MHDDDDDLTIAAFDEMWNSFLQDKTLRLMIRIELCSYLSAFEPA